MTTPKATFAGLALIAALCAGFTLGLTAPAWAGLDEGVAALLSGLAIPLQRLGVVPGDAAAFVVHDTEIVLSFGVALLGKRTPLTDCRCVVAAMIGCHTLIPTSPRRCRQAQCEPASKADIGGAGQNPTTPRFMSTRPRA